MNVTEATKAAASLAFEREQQVRAVMLAIIARAHVLLVGPPGTAKSYLVRAVSHALGLSYCERLLSQTAPIEVLFGPPDLKALKEGVFRYVTKGSIVDSQVVFLDEVGRGSAEIQNALLHLLGPERQYLNGTDMLTAPLVSCIGASNSWNDHQGDGAAFADRWLIRCDVPPVTNKTVLMFGNLPEAVQVCSPEEVAAATSAASALPIPGDTRAAWQEILQELAVAGIHPSDRRLRQSISVARASAALDGATEVTRESLEDLGMVLWSDPDHREKTASVILNVVSPNMGSLRELLQQARAINSASKSMTRADLANECPKLDDIEKRAKSLLGMLADNFKSRALATMAEISQISNEAKMRVLGFDPSKVKVGTA